MPYELGANGDIAAILFGAPFFSPPAKSHNNKILWVSRLAVNGSTLVLTARRVAGSRPIGSAVTREVVGGPGPSIIDLPAAGCWRVRLAWSGHHDTLYLDYRRGNSPKAVSTRGAERVASWAVGG